MTAARAIEIIENEIACVRRASNGCDRKCESCDLLMDTDEILLAYAEAINSIEAWNRQEVRWGN